MNDIYSHLLAEVVSYLEYHWINLLFNNNNDNTKNIKGVVHPKEITILSSCTHPHVVSNLSFVENSILKTVGNKAVLVNSDFHCMNKQYWDVSQIILFHVP